MTRYCQMCGSPMFSLKNMGVEMDGTLNADFCALCYRFGRFIKEQGPP